MPILTSKVTPAPQDKKDHTEVVPGKSFKMFVMPLPTVFKRYGVRRHPKIEPYEELRDRGDLVLWKYVPPDSKMIYISHEWVGTNHPDPHGDQMYHLLLLLERLRRGDVDRTDMDAFHSLLYNQNYTTTAEEWKIMLDPQTTYIFYDGFCVPRENREETFRMVPEFIKRCASMSKQNEDVSSVVEE